MAGHHTPIEKRFWKKVKKTNSCWIWIGCRNFYGYGRIGDWDKVYLAHRISYQIHKGIIPKNKGVFHTCDNSFCVNPKHLWVGTQAENIMDMVKKGRYGSKRNIPRGEDTFQAKLTWKQVKEIRKRYVRGVFGVPRLAKIYGVNNKTMFCIIHNLTWKNN